MKAKDFYEQGKQFYEKGEYDSALKAFDKAIELDDKFTMPWNGKGNVYLGLNDYDSALKAYDKSIELGCKNYYPWNGKGYVYSGLNDYDSALKAFDKAIELNDKSAGPWNGKGNVYLRLNDYNSALIAYNKAIELNDKFAGSWYGKGNALHSLGDCDSALKAYDKAIELDDKFGYPWNGKGNLYYGLNDYNSALISYNKAIELNDKFTDPWNGKGNVFFKLKDFDSALKAYDKSIELDDKNVYPWNGKGNLYFNLTDYRLSKISFLRAHYLESKLIGNLLVFSSTYPQTPWFTYKVLNQFIDPKNFNSWKNLITLTIDQCRFILPYIGFLLLTKKNKQLKNWEWNQFLGLVYYNMGDPIESFALFQKVLRIKKTDLQTYFYLIKSCYEFAEPEQNYLQTALELAEKIKPEKKRFSFFRKKKVNKLNEYEIKQQYYAGQLYYLNEELAKALIYFEEIKKTFLPAAYMCLLIKYQQTGMNYKSLTKEIYSKEEKVWGTEKSFAQGIQKQFLDLERVDFRVPFFHYSHYSEIEEGIELFYRSAKEYKFNEISKPPEREAFWYNWELSKEQLEQIYQVGQREYYDRLKEELMGKREKDLKKEKRAKELSEEEELEKVRAEQSDKFQTAYEKLKKESSQELCEERLGAMMNDWDEITKAEQYQKLTSLLFLGDHLSAPQKIRLDFFSVIQETAHKKPSDILLAGAKDGFKAIIGESINLLSAVFRLTDGLLGLFIKPIIKATLAEIILKYLKQSNAKYDSYASFRISFSEFIAKEKKGLGDDFDKEYPLFGFDI